MKLILGAIVVVAPIVYFILKRWVGKAAEKDRLLKKIRDCENEMAKLPVGSNDYNIVRDKWRLLNKRWSDITGHD